MSDDKLQKISLLMQKWELYWNHLKLQHEMIERRRYFLWIIQSALFIGWFHLFYKIKSPLSLMICSIGLAVSVALIFILKKENESVLLTEMSLRDTEDQINIINDGIKLERFTIDKKLMAPHSNESHIFRHSFEVFNKAKLEEYWLKPKNSRNSIDNILKIIFPGGKYNSTRIWLNVIFAKIFLLAWIFILCFTLFFISKLF
jgi:hypothetical protein